MNADRYCKRCDAVTAREKDGQCKPCHAKRSAATYAANIEKYREAHKQYGVEHKAEARARKEAWNKANPERVKEQARKDYLRNKEKVNARTALWAKNNAARQKELVARWVLENPQKVNYNARKRKQSLEQRKPKWADENAMKAIYLQAAEFRAAGIDVEVDHFYPLRGKLVSGLHCEANLQILTRHENKSKSNRYSP